jgi:hypothetical protein
MNRYAALAKTWGAFAAPMLVATVLVPGSAAAAPRHDRWKFRFDLCAWFPSVGGKTTFPAVSGGSDVSVDADDLLKSLNGIFMGGFEAKRGAGAPSPIGYSSIAAMTSRPRTR